MISALHVDMAGNLAASAHQGVQPTAGCAWWNLACKGGEQAANAGLSAITKSIASGAEMLLSQIVRIIDKSSTVPLEDPTYRHVYFGFLGLATPIIGVVLLIAVVIAAVRRDAGTLGRAVVGIGVASIGGALYIVFAQLLIAIDDSLAHGVVKVTGYNLGDSIEQIAVGFHQIAGNQGDVAANMLLLLLMLIMLVAGLILWFVLVLRKVAILVVVAFAPLLIVGYLWTPTRSWVRKTTEVLVALVFTKTAIFTLFGVGLALLSRGGGQSLSDFVGTTVLMCGACFAPLLMLRLVHFAADTHLAGDAIGTLRGGVQPVASRMPGRNAMSAMTRHDFAREHSRNSSSGGSPQPVKVGAMSSTGPTGAGGVAAGSASAGAAAGGVATAGIALGAKAGSSAVKSAGQRAGAHAAELTAPPDRAERPLRGPSPGTDNERGGAQQ